MYIYYAMYFKERRQTIVFKWCVILRCEILVLRHWWREDEGSADLLWGKVDVLVSTLYLVSADLILYPFARWGKRRALLMYVRKRKSRQITRRFIVTRLQGWSYVNVKFHSLQNMLELILEGLKGIMHIYRMWIARRVMRSLAGFEEGYVRIRLLLTRLKLPIKNSKLRN